MSLFELKPFVDAGHGGKDPGAINYDLGIKEKNVTLKYAKAIANDFYKAGIFKTVLRRTDDSYMHPYKIAELADNSGCNILISLHCDSVTDKSVTGTSIYTSVGYTRSDIYAQEIGLEIQRACVNDQYNRAIEFTKKGQPNLLLPKNWFFKWRGLKERNYAVLWRTKRIYAVLIELDFISNNDRANWLNSESTIYMMSKAIVKGTIRAHHQGV